MGEVPPGYDNRGFDDDDKKMDLDDFYVEPPPYSEKIALELELEGKEKENEEKKIDKYDITQIEFSDTGPDWKDMTTGQRAKRSLITIFGVIFAIGLLYIFICSLDILQNAFQLMTGRVAGSAFSSNTVLSNPMAGLVLGVLATVLLQSSSTSTSIIVSLVGAGVLDVKNGIYLIMGANIGTSVTNTIVSLTQSADKETFRRSFAGATVHDMFNWLTVLILLPLEAASGYLSIVTREIVKHINPRENTDSEEPQFLKVITEPLTARIIKVDKAVLSAVAEGDDRGKYPLCRYYCKTEYDTFEETWPIGEQNESFIEGIKAMPWTINIQLKNVTNESTSLFWDDINNQSTLCTHHFTGCAVDGTWCSLSDLAVGGILLASSLFIMLASVILLVKILGAVLKGPMAKAIQVGLNASLPGKAKFLTGYLAILMGAGLTMLVQSSSVFTSTMTPLVGMGLISVERMFPLTLGSNIGTCLTGILAALTADPDAIRNTMQVALAHLFFNISGIVLFYPIPFLRKLPLNAAKFMGDTTAEYRWFAVAYLILVFFLLPGAIFGLSMAGWKVVVGVLVPIGCVILVIVIIKCMQHYCPQKMHPCMRDWQWLPKPLRSLEPCNRVVTKCCYNESCIKCRKSCACSDSDDEEMETDDTSSTSSRESSPSGSTVYIVDESKEPQTPSVTVDIGDSNPAYQYDSTNDPDENTRF